MSANAPENLRSQPTLPPTAPRLRLLAATQDGQVQCEMTRPICLIGSRRDCHLPLSHPDISKIHAAIINTGNAILVRDLVSRSGTFINNAPVRLSVLRPGDVLRIGPVTVTAEFHQPPQDGQDADLLRLPRRVALEWSGGRVELSGNAAVIGRRSGADLMVDTPDVSLAHALVLALGDRLVLCDLGSRSGTLLNGQRVEMAWLDDGDCLTVGGEQITVRAADGAADRTSAGAGQTVGQVGASAEAALRLADMRTGTLGELEQVIAAVHQQVAAARARIDEQSLRLEQREAELARQRAELEAAQAALTEQQAGFQQREQALASSEAAAQQRLAQIAEQERQLAEKQAAIESEQNGLQRRRAELDSLAAELNRQREELDSQRAGLAAQTTELEAARAALEQQRQAVEQAASACRQREEAAEHRAAELEALAARTAQDRADLETQRAELDSAQAALTEAKAALEAQQQEVQARLQALELREHQAAEREAALAAREARQAEVARRIAEFKATLSQASQVLASVSQPTGSLVAESPKTSTPASAGGLESQSLEQSGEELPAPVVDQPLFAPARVCPPADWPPELRERFRVLRRVSNKSDEELLAQVWSDREKVLEQHRRSGKKFGRGGAAH